jgi:hypothetical protein
MAEESRRKIQLHEQARRENFLRDYNERMANYRVRFGKKR